MNLNKKGCEHDEIKTYTPCKNPYCDGVRPICFGALHQKCSKNGATLKWHHFSYGEHLCYTCFSLFSSNFKNIATDSIWSQRFFNWKIIHRPAFSNNDPLCHPLLSFIASNILPWWIRCNKCKKWRQLTYTNTNTSNNFSTFICENQLKFSCDSPQDERITIASSNPSAFLASVEAYSLVQNENLRKVISSSFNSISIGLNSRKLQDYDHKISPCEYLISPFYDPELTELTSEIFKSGIIWSPVDLDSWEKHTFFPEVSKLKLLYLAIRNSILNLWVQNPSVIITTDLLHHKLYIRGIVRAIVLDIWVPHILRELTNQCIVNFGVFSAFNSLNIYPEQNCMIVYSKNDRYISYLASNIQNSMYLNGSRVKFNLVPSRFSEDFFLNEYFEIDNSKVPICISKMFSIGTNTHFEFLTHQLNLKPQIFKANEEDNVFYGCPFSPVELKDLDITSFHVSANFIRLLEHHESDWKTLTLQEISSRVKDSIPDGLNPNIVQYYIREIEWNLTRLILFNPGLCAEKNISYQSMKSLSLETLNSLLSMVPCINGYGLLSDEDFISLPETLQASREYNKLDSNNAILIALIQTHETESSQKLTWQLKTNNLTNFSETVDLVIIDEPLNQILFQFHENPLEELARVNLEEKAEISTCILLPNYLEDSLKNQIYRSAEQMDVDIQDNLGRMVVVTLILGDSLLSIHHYSGSWFSLINQESIPDLCHKIFYQIKGESFIFQTYSISEHADFLWDQSNDEVIKLIYEWLQTSFKTDKKPPISVSSVRRFEPVQKKSSSFSNILFSDGSEHFLGISSIWFATLSQETGLCITRGLNNSDKKNSLLENIDMTFLHPSNSLFHMATLKSSRMLRSLSKKSNFFGTQRLKNNVFLSNDVHTKICRCLLKPFLSLSAELTNIDGDLICEYCNNFKIESDHSDSETVESSDEENAYSQASNL